MVGVLVVIEGQIFTSAVDDDVAGGASRHCDVVDEFGLKVEVAQELVRAAEDDPVVPRRVVSGDSSTNHDRAIYTGSSCSNSSICDLYCLRAFRPAAVI